MDAITAAELAAAETVRDEVATREAFYADEELWAHEFCGADCDGEEH